MWKAEAGRARPSHLTDSHLLWPGTTRLWESQAPVWVHCPTWFAPGYPTVTLKAHLASASLGVSKVPIKNEPVPTPTDLKQALGWVRCILSVDIWQLPAWPKAL